MAYKRRRSADIKALLAGGSRIGARSVAALSGALLRALTVVTTLTVPAMADGGAGGQGGDPSAAGGIGGSGYGGASGGSSGPSTTAGSGGGGGGAAGGGSGGSSGNTASVGGAAGGTTPGQDGSNGTTASSPSGGGGGAGGNNGAVATAPFNNMANSTGQNGGNGGNGGAGTDSGSTGGGGGGGGAGGVGFVFSDSSSFTNGNFTIQGGAGGNGGAGGSAAAANGNGGTGGDGGTGLLLTSPGATVTNSGTIKGGVGGAAGAAGAGTGTAGAAGAAGAGGAGIVGSGLTIINSGSIQGGFSGDGTRANSITFTGGNNTLTFMNAEAGLTGAIGLATSSTTLTIAQSTNSTLDQMITGAGSVKKTDSGVLTLTGNNTYTGGTAISAGTTISAGTLQLGNGGTTGSITGWVANNSALSFNRSDTYTFDGYISGVGSVNQIGPGTTVLTGNSNYSGGTTISAGTLQIGNGDRTGSITGDVINNASLVFKRSGTYVFGGAISGTGGVSKAGTGTVILTGTNTYSGGTTISSGILQIGSGGSTGSITGDVINNGSLMFNRAGRYTFDGAISGVGGVRKFGNGITILTGTNTYTGLTSISVGVLQIGDGGTAGSITGQVSNNSELWFNRSDAYTFGGVISGWGSVSQLGPGTTVLTGNSTYTGGTTISAGTLQIGDGGTTGSIAYNVTNNGTLAFNRSNALTFSGLISGTGSVAQLGSGNLSMSGANTYTGGTTISRGTVTVGNNSALGVGDVKMTQGATLAFGIQDYTLANNFVISGTSIFNIRTGTTQTITGAVSDGDTAGIIEKTGSGTLTLVGRNTYTGGTTVSGSTLQIGNGGTSGSISGDVINNASLAFNRSDTNAFGGAISGTGGVRQLGAGTTVLTGNNTYIGGTTISRGRLQIGDGGTSGSITGDVINDASLAFDRSDKNAFGGAISGTGGVSQLGTGTTVLTGANTYTGGTTISHGRLQIGDGGTSGSISGDVINNASLAFNRSDTYTFGGVISGTGAVAQLGSGNLSLSGANTYTGGTTISGGTVTVGNNSAFGVGDVKMTQGATLAFGIQDYTLANNFVISGTSIFNIRTGTTQTITGAVSDGDTAGIIQKNGGGKLILNGRNSFSGGTIINAGTLQLANSNMLSATTAATVASGTTLDLGGFDQTIGSLAGAGSVALGAALLTTGADNSSTNFSGAMSGTGGLTKQGTGNLVLSGTNDYTGPTTINAGTLSVNGSIASAVTAASGGRLGGSGSVGSTTIASGGTLAPGNSIGTLTVNGDLTFAAGSSYAVEVSPTASDRTNVTGRATLAGTVQASYASGSYISKRYTIVNAAGGVAGTFGALVDTNLPTNFTSALAYDANNAYLDLTLAFIPPAAPDYGNGLSRNQQQVAGALVNSFNVAGGIPTTLGTLKPDGLSQASGEAGAALQQSLFGSADLFMRSVFSNALDPNEGSAGRECAVPRSQAGPRDACAALPPAAAPASRWSLWGAGYGGTLRVGGDASTGSHDTTSRVAGAAAGASYQLSPQARVGFALGGSGSSFSLAQGLGSGSSDNFNAALYGRYQIGPSYLAAALGYVWQDATVDRTVTVAGGEALRARMHPQALTARVEGGQRLQVSGIGVTPYAALQTTTMFLPTFGEVGTSVFALDYAGRQPTVTRSELGARFDDEVFIDGRPLALRARAAWAHGWNTDWQAAATLRQIPAAQFNVYGAALPGDSVQVSLGASLGLGRGWTVSAAFDGEFWKHADSYAGRALVSYQW
ncbi:autotransporter-associated beta strand repeat-containing protein [Rhodopseudomonas palustris]|uniref:autotransporter-associated beta strand repeat-containing protein n=1 Tax=Rhodopseudomonas palustris TaxID=1076 RepID=UPI0021F345EC|nr:autotransporter-associated beta strand repeat-containing protein [Rhodopseudomonas palustris]